MNKMNKFRINYIIMVVIFFTLLPIFCSANCVVDALGPGQYNDLLLQYYLDGGATSLDIQDAEYEFLVAQGATPASTQDMWYELLYSLGYSGGLSDMLWSFWCTDGGVIYTVTMDGERVTMDGETVTMGGV